ncbi:glycosyltransferase family 2 protein [Sulfurospirillum sp. 1612]|uniref:glycosyltransferase family 2 protein n=1 Tax=Sulfurospirillum sp. 1612 TaxID=3094835 RepID=UPI002F95EF6D
MKITAIIPTYNRADFLPQSIASILKQTRGVDEIIIVDDGSNDTTQEVLQHFKTIKIIQTQNNGVSHARNIGIKAAQHEWITFLDSDDIWLDKKIEMQCSFHQMHPDILFSHTNEQWLRDGKKVKYSKNLTKPEGWCFLENMSRCKIAASSVMMHKSIFEHVGYFDEEMRVCEDYDLWLRVALFYEIGLIKEACIIKNSGHEQLSNTIFAIDRYHIKTLLKLLDSSYHDAIKQQICNKCEILIKGALKHHNQEIYETYSKMIRDIQS